jgi:hypothetical protein
MENESAQEVTHCFAPDLVVKDKIVRPDAILFWIDERLSQVERVKVGEFLEEHGWFVG